MNLGTQRRRIRWDAIGPCCLSCALGARWRPSPLVPRMAQQSRAVPRRGDHRDCGVMHKRAEVRRDAERGWKRASGNDNQGGVRYSSVVLSIGSMAIAEAPCHSSVGTWSLGARERRRFPGGRRPSLRVVG